MRTVFAPQMTLGQVDVADIQLDPKSRDDIPQLLRGLQHIHTDPGLRKRVLAILEGLLPDRAGAEGKASPSTGRPGMAQWRILVLGVLRLGLNADYDRIQELANQHATIRLMLGHGDWADESYYELQTLKDNLMLFTPEILDRINREVVRAGHKALKKSLEEGLNARADSFMVETDVEYPTGTGLLYDAVRKALGLCAELSRRARADRLEEIQQAHRGYLGQAETLLVRVRETRQQLASLPAVPLQLALLDDYLRHADRQAGQIRRRVLEGEAIPHAEKVFSLFEPHTEWVSKGKAGMPVELGLKVCVVEDQHGFVRHHHVMERTTDDQVAVPVAEQTQRRFPSMASISFDKGFHSPANQSALKEIVGLAVLPRKGKLSQAA